MVLVLKIDRNVLFFLLKMIFVKPSISLINQMKDDQSDNKSTNLTIEEGKEGDFNTILTTLESTYYQISSLI